MNFVEPIRDKKKIDAMKTYLRGRNLRDFALFTLGINSGLRISDLLRLTVADVTDERGQILDRIELKEKKTGKTKEFPLGDTSRKALKEYLAAVQPRDSLFPSKKGGRALRRQHVWTVLSQAASAVGIKARVGTHTLRKTFGYQAYKQGSDISVIQQLLNHSSPQVTLRYIGITKDDLDKVYLNLNL